MIHTIDRASENEGAVLRAMFEARKRVFVDLLKWDVPVLGGAWELDQFDDSDATYLVLTDRDGGHLASARLLKTTQPHILGFLFADLVEGEVPSGPRICEITRFCLDRSLRAIDRRRARDQLISALAEHALSSGIEGYTGVAEIAWFRQIQHFGWRCRALGKPKIFGGAMLTAMQIEIDEETPALLAATGVWSPPAGGSSLHVPSPAAQMRA
jgi:acyl-homoserine lactone synthase